MNILKILLISLFLISCQPAEESSDISVPSRTEFESPGPNLQISSSIGMDTDVSLSVTDDDPSESFMDGTVFTFYSGPNCTNRIKEYTLRGVFVKKIYATVTFNHPTIYNISVKYVNPLGFYSKCSKTVSYELTPPSLPTQITLVSQEGSPSNNVNPRFKVEDLIYEYGVTVYDNPTCVGDPIAITRGSSFYTSALYTGIHSIYVRVTSEEGYVSDCSDKLFEYTSTKDHTSAFSKLPEVEAGTQFEYGDIDNDGNIDYVRRYREKMFIHYGDGAGNYISVEFSHNDNIREFKLFDLDKDGDLDIIYNGDDDHRQLLMLENKGARSLVSKSFHQTEFYQIKEFNYADIDGDGLKDFMYSGGGSHPRYLKGKGDGTYEDAQPLFPDSTSIPYANFVDIDGDGDIDIVSSNTWTRKSEIFKNNGSGIFTLVRTISEYGKFTVGDFNNDDQLDWAFAKNDGGLLVHILNSDASIASTVETVKVNFQGGSSIRSVDLNNDGNLDVVYTDNYFSTIEVYLAFGNGDGTFQPPELIYGVSDYYDDINLFDYNSDGKIDIIGRTKFIQD